MTSTENIAIPNVSFDENGELLIIAAPTSSKMTSTFLKENQKSITGNWNPG